MPQFPSIFNNTQQTNVHIYWSSHELQLSAQIWNNQIWIEFLIIPNIIALQQKQLLVESTCLLFIIYIMITTAAHNHHLSSLIKIYLLWICIAYPSKSISNISVFWVAASKCDVFSYKQWRRQAAHICCWLQTDNLFGKASQTCLFGLSQTIQWHLRNQSLDYN